MVPALLSSLSIPACHLEMSLRTRTNPNIRPRWRNHKRLDPCQRLGIFDRLAICVHIAEAFAGPLSNNPRLCVRYISQPRIFRGLNRITDILLCLHRFYAILIRSAIFDLVGCLNHQNRSGPATISIPPFDGMRVLQIITRGKVRLVGVAVPAAFFRLHAKRESSVFLCGVS